MKRILSAAMATSAAIIGCNATVTYTDTRRLAGAGDTLMLDDATAGKDSLRFCAIDVAMAIDRTATGRQRSAWWELSWADGSARLEFDVSDYTDGINQPEVRLFVCGTPVSVGKSLDPCADTHTIGLEWADGIAAIFAGSRRMSGIGTVAMPAPHGPFRLTASAPCRLIGAGIEAEEAPNLSSGMSVDEIERYFSENTHQAPEGIWEYLDRDTDPSLALPGGSYRLAVMKSGEGDFMVIYLGGAVTNASAWHPGMVKGRIRDLGFTDHYGLEWNDAMMLPMDSECYAELPSPEVISFHFPLWGNASLRFRKTK